MMDTWQSCLHAGPSRTYWLGNKYEDKKRTDRRPAGVGVLDGFADGCALQHEIEKTTAVLRLSTLAGIFPTVSPASSVKPRHARMVAGEIVAVNPNSLFCRHVLRGFRRRFRAWHDHCGMPSRPLCRHYRCGYHPSGTTPCPDVLPAACLPPPCCVPFPSPPVPPTASPAIPSPPARR